MIRQPGRLRRIRRAVLPSAALAGYIVRLYASRFLVILIILISILQMLDLLNRSEDILAADGATEASLLRYIQWRLPELASQFTPFAGLLASLFTLAGLNQSSEITIMRAAGLSATQMIIPVLLASLLITVVHIALHDMVTVDASRHLAFWQDNGYQPDTPPPPDGRTNIWLNDGDRVIEIGRATRFVDRIILDEVSVYQRSPDGDLVANIDADFALSEGKGWTLYGVRRFDVNSFVVSAADTMPFDFSLPVARLFAQLDRPDHARIAVLWRSIATLREAGMETFTLETSLWHRFSLAASAVIMPLLGSFVAFGVPRGGARVGRIIAGMALGFSYFVFDNYMVAMGSLGILPALMAASAAPAIYTLAGLSILVRLE